MEVADEYRLSGQTLHLTVYLIDSFLSRLHDVERRYAFAACRLLLGADPVALVGACS